MKFAIVGFGQAGYHAARAIRSRDATSAIHVFSDTAHPPYNPMLTTYYVAGKLPREGMFPYGSLKEIAASLRLTLNEAPVQPVSAKVTVSIEGKVFRAQAQTL